jgi:hypothetical protein
MFSNLGVPLQISRHEPTLLNDLFPRNLSQMNSKSGRFGTLCLAALLFAPAIVSAQVTFFGMGDLPGGITQSEVRDTTRVGTVLYAVGGSAANAGGSTGNDTAFLWTSTGGMTALPQLVSGTFNASNPVIASAITPDAAYIASRARFNTATPGQRHAVRVTTATAQQPPLDLGYLPGFPEFSAANAISNDGAVLYGFARYVGGASPQTQAVRYTVAGPTITAIPLLNVGDNTSSPVGRGTSSDGSVMVGTSTNTVASGGKFIGPGNAAFRYVDGSGISAIPYLPGGTWNIALALSPDGNLAMVAGDSTAAPNGEVYLYNATTDAKTALGTPAAGWGTTNIAGMTADGSVVVIAMGDPVDPVGASFLHNANGWHDVQAIVAGAGVNLAGWTLNNIGGMSADGTRIWGAGNHNGNTEGFVVEFPAGYLAAYGASLPAQSLVGSYTGSDWTQEGSYLLVLMANGTYYEIEDSLPTSAPGGVDGFERGTYTWDPATKAFTLTTLLDTNGVDAGPNGISGVSGVTATVLGKYLSLHFPGPPAEAFTAPTVIESSGIVGTWVAGDTAVADSSAVLRFFANGFYMFAQDGPNNDPNGHDGMERGTYTWNSGTGAFTAAALTDTNGTWGLSNPSGSVTVTVSGDTLTYTDGSGPVTYTRVVAPRIAPSAAVMMTERVHGSAGPFDLVMSTVTAPNVNHNPTTEPRLGPNHNVVFTFDKPVTAATVAVSEGTATAGAPTFSGNLMTVPLTGVTDRQYVTVTATDVASADGGTGGSASVRVGFLLGDVTQNRVVSLQDLAFVNAQLAQPLTAANFLKDVNVSGTLTLADKGFTNSNLTKALPPP